MRQHVQGGLQLRLGSSSKPPDCAVAALTELFAADNSDTLLHAPLNLTFGRSQWSCYPPTEKVSKL